MAVTSVSLPLVLSLSLKHHRMNAKDLLELVMLVIYGMLYILATCVHSSVCIGNIVGKMWCIYI